MRTWFALATAATMAVAPAAYAADRAIEAPIRTMLEAFNKGDVALAKSTHVAAPMILDEPTAPFAWSGPTAFDDWLAALGKSEANAGKTGGQVALGGHGEMQGLQNHWEMRLMTAGGMTPHEALHEIGRAHV